MESGLLIEELVAEAARNRQNPMVKLSSKNYSRVAAVACIIRIINTSNMTVNINDFIDRRSFYNNSNIQLEVLLMKRSERPSDPWSGDFAFPGGHVEKDETELEAVMRETMEEIGLNLNDSSRFMLCGQLPSKTLKTRKGRILAIPHVFLDLRQLVHTQCDIPNDSDNTNGMYDYTEYICNPSEVDHVRWVSLNFIHDQIFSGSGISLQRSNTDQVNSNSTNTGISDSRIGVTVDKQSPITVAIDIHKKYLQPIRNKNKVIYWVATILFRLIDVQKIVCACVYLPKARPCHTSNVTSDNDSTAINCSHENNSICNDNSSNSTGINRDTVDIQHPLWGMTYGVFCDLFMRHYKHSGKHKTHLINSKLVRFDNAILNTIVMVLYNTSRLFYSANVLFDYYFYIVIIAAVLYLIFKGIIVILLTAFALSFII